MLPDVISVLKTRTDKVDEVASAVQNDIAGNGKSEMGFSKVVEHTVKKNVARCEKKILRVLVYLPVGECTMLNLNKK